MHLDSVSAWCWLFVCTGTVALILVIVHLIHSLGTKRKVSLFYCWLGALAVWGGALAFLLPIALNSGFGKDHDGSALRQALLYATGGVLAVITLGETHRKNSQEKEKNENDHIRQVHAERRSRYTIAVEQLANEKAAVRLGGIYTLVGLVDEWLADGTLNPEKRQKEGQVIINNLCSYVRSPFPHAELRELFEKSNSEESIPKEDRDEFLKKQTQFREEQNIRHTILIETTNRLSNQKEKPENEEKIPQKGPWSDFSYNFSGTHFLYNVDFRNIVVNSHINFSRSVFGQVVSFHNSIFKESISFGGAKFEDSSSFVEVNFKKSSTFYGANFKGVVSFKKSTFESSTSFHDVTFKNITSFKSTRFEAKADFGDAHFYGNEDFSNAFFGDEADFSYSQFIKTNTASRKTSNFNKVIFEKFLNFKEASFEGFTNFSEAYFGGDSSFISAKFKTFNEFVDFTNATFIGLARFSNSIFLDSVNFHGARFINKEPRFAFHDSSILMACFSCGVTPESYIFSVSSHSPYKIQLGQSEISGKNFIVPEGTILFDPMSWNEEKQKYTRVSAPAKPLDDSDSGEENITE